MVVNVSQTDILDLVWYVFFLIAYSFGIRILMEKK